MGAADVHSGDLPKTCRFFIPDFIIADLNTVTLTSVVGYMTRYPGISLLGIGRSLTVTAVSCDQFTVQSSADLARVIRQALPQRVDHAPTLSIGIHINPFGRHRPRMV